MPLCLFYTNVSSDKVPENFEIRLTELIADVLSKPIEKITVNLLTGQRIVRAGTREPTCLLQLWSIGVFDEERNSNYSAKLFPFIEESLGISSERIGILYRDIKAYDVGKLS